MATIVPQTVVCYAEHTEDIILARFLADIEQGFYVDIGAAWATCHSVTKFFYERGWHGINIEPIQEYFSTLCVERSRDINIQAAISDTSGTASFYVHGGNSTLSSEIAESCAAIHNLEFQTITVPTYTLNQVFDTYVKDKDVHFLKIDAEHHEKTILTSIDFEKYHPWILCIESVRPDTGENCYDEYEPLLFANGYVFTLEQDGNRYYILQYKQQERVRIYQTTPEWNIVKMY